VSCFGSSHRTPAVPTKLQGLESMPLQRVPPSASSSQPRRSRPSEGIGFFCARTWKRSSLPYPCFISSGFSHSGGVAFSLPLRRPSGWGSVAVGPLHTTTPPPTTTQTPTQHPPHHPLYSSFPTPSYPVHLLLTNHLRCVHFFSA